MVVGLENGTLIVPIRRLWNFARSRCRRGRPIMRQGHVATGIWAQRLLQSDDQPVGEIIQLSRGGLALWASLEVRANRLGLGLRQVAHQKGPQILDTDTAVARHEVSSEREGGNGTKLYFPV